jgi:hypothetical protein
VAQKNSSTPHHPARERWAAACSSNFAPKIRRREEARRGCGAPTDPPTKFAGPHISILYRSSNPSSLPGFQITCYAQPSISTCSRAPTHRHTCNKWKGIVWTCGKAEGTATSTEKQSTGLNCAHNRSRTFPNDEDIRALVRIWNTRFNHATSRHVDHPQCQGANLVQRLLALFHGWNDGCNNVELC